MGESLCLSPRMTCPFLKLWNVSKIVTGGPRLLDPISQVFSAISSAKLRPQCPAQLQTSFNPFPALVSFWCSLAGSDQLKRSTRHAKRAAECLLSHCGKQQERENASGTLQENEVAFVEIQQHPCYGRSQYSGRWKLCFKESGLTTYIFALRTHQLHL